MGDTKILTNALDLIAQMAIPLMLITLGVAVARLKPPSYKTLGISLSKIMIGIIAGIGVGYQFNLPYEAFAVLVIQMSMPVAVTSIFWLKNMVRTLKLLRVLL